MPDYIRQKLRRLENAVLDTFDFWGNVLFYLGRGHRPGQAFSLARKTLPQRDGR